MEHIDKTCELCKMSATHTEKDGHGTSHFFCDHHSLHGHKKSKDAEWKKLLPFFSILGGILFLSSLRQFIHGLDGWMFMMDFMGIFLIVFGAFKLLDLKGFVDGFEKYDIITKRWRGYGYLFPFIEIGLGVLYLVGFMFLWQNLAVLIITSIGVYTAYAWIGHEDDIRCVCLGTFVDLPMTWVTFYENLIMLLMVLFMMLM